MQWEADCHLSRDPETDISGRHGAISACELPSPGHGKGEAGDRINKPQWRAGVGPLPRAADARGKHRAGAGSSAAERVELPPRFAIHTSSVVPDGYLGR